jgi:OOP family OmpA-OmpF porin
MKAKQAVLTAFAAAAVLGTSQAAAQLQISGAYLGGSLGQMKADDACRGIAGGVSCDDDDTAWRLFGGYQLNRNLAVELGFADLGKVEARAGGINASADLEAWDLVGLGMLPLGNFSLYGKAGAYRGEVKARANTAFLSGSAKETTTDFTFGLGARYDFSRNFAVRAEWQRYNDMGGDDVGESDVDVMSVGLQYTFN